MGILATWSQGTPDALGKEAGAGVWLQRAESFPLCKALGSPPWFQQLQVESQAPFCPGQIHRYSGRICAANSNFDQSLILEGHKPLTKLGWIWQALFPKKPNKTNKPNTGGSFWNFKTFHSKVFSKQRGWLHVGVSEMSLLEVLLKNPTLGEKKMKFNSKMEHCVSDQTPCPKLTQDFSFILYIYI